MKYIPAILVGLVFLTIIIGSIIMLNKPTEIKTETQTYLIPKSVSSTQIRFEGNPLVDSTVFNNVDNTCTASRNNMNIKIEPCVAQDVDGQDIEQKVNFTWNGASSQNVGWIFVYDGDLINGRVEVDRQVTREVKQVNYVNTWMNNYLVQNVASYTDMGTPTAFCNLGNNNNTQMYSVTFVNGTTKNICFTTRTTVNSTAFRISGNYDAAQDYWINWTTKEKVDVTDRFVKIANPFDDGKSYYRVDEVNFNPSQTISTYWTYTPKNKSKAGKWHILGYNADIGLVQSIVQNQYIYVDPWWDNSWTRKVKIEVNTTEGYVANRSVLIRVPFDSDMQTDMDDIRFLNESENAEMGYWKYNNTCVDSTYCDFWVLFPQNWSAAENQTIYAYYGNAGASTTSDITKAFWFADDFTTIDYASKWKTNGYSLYNVTTYNGMSVFVANGTGSSNLEFQSFPYFANGYILELRTTGTPGSGFDLYASFTENTNYSLTGNDLGEMGSAAGFMLTRLNDAASPASTAIAGEWMRIEAKIPVTGNALANISNDNRVQNVSKVGAPARRGGYLGILNWNNAAYRLYIDWVYYRKYVSVEPTYVFGTEESGSGITVSQSYPANLQNFTSSIIPFQCNYTATGNNISSVTIAIVNSSNSVNYTNTEGSLATMSYNKTWNPPSLRDGTYQWACFGSSITGVNASTTNRTFYIDTTGPSITIIYPVNNTMILTNTTNTTIILNATVSDPRLSVCRYNVYDDTYWRNYTIFTCNTTQTINFTNGGGNKKIEVWANDTLGNAYNTSTEFYLNYHTYSYYFVNTTVESASANYYLNVTASNTSSVLANISFNGTFYEMTESSDNGTLATFTRSITTPTVTNDTILRIWFNYSLNGTIQGTQFYNQTVNNIPDVGTNCTQPSLFFRLLDEETDAAVSGTFDYNFQYGVTNSTEKTTYGTATGTTLSICVNTTISPNYTVGYGEVTYSATNYNTRRYYIWDGTQLNNVTQNITIYSLLTASQTTFQLTSKDTTLNPFVGKYTTLVRWYPDLNDYRIVDMGKTDEDGNTIIHVKAEDVDYKLGVYYTNGTLIKLSDAIRMYCTATPCTYTFIVGDTVIATWKVYENISGFSYGLSYNKTTKVTTYTYNDTNSGFELARLFVQLQNSSGKDRTVCNVTSNLSVASIACNVSNFTSGEFVARAYNTRDGDESLIYTLRFEITQIADIMGTEGLLMGWFIILVTSMIFLANKIAGVVAINGAFILVKIIGLIQFSMLFLFSIMGISAILIVIFRQEGAY